MTAAVATTITTAAIAAGIAALPETVPSHIRGDAIAAAVKKAVEAARPTRGQPLPEGWRETRFRGPQPTDEWVAAVRAALTAEAAKRRRMVPVGPRLAGAALFRLHPAAFELLGGRVDDENGAPYLPQGPVEASANQMLVADDLTEDELREVACCLWDAHWAHCFDSLVARRYGGPLQNVTPACVQELIDAGVISCDWAEEVALYAASRPILPDATAEEMEADFDEDRRTHA